MASASDYRAHAALQPADCLILLPQRLPAAVETSIRPAHYPAECTQSDAFLQPSLRARKGRANSNSFYVVVKSRPARDSLIRRKNSLMARLNSLQGRIKFPVPMRRELGRKPLNSAIDFEPIVALGGLDEQIPVS